MFRQVYFVALLVAFAGCTFGDRILPDPVYRESNWTVAVATGGISPRNECQIDSNMAVQDTRTIEGLSFNVSDPAQCWILEASRRIVSDDEVSCPIEFQGTFTNMDVSDRRRGNLAMLHGPSNITVEIAAGQNDWLFTASDSYPAPLTFAVEFLCDP